MLIKENQSIDLFNMMVDQILIQLRSITIKEIYVEFLVLKSKFLNECGDLITSVKYMKEAKKIC